VLAVSTGLVFAVGALVSVFVIWAAFTLAFARFSEMAGRSEDSERGR
jgi:hypothetical protein